MIKNLCGRIGTALRHHRKIFAVLIMAAVVVATIPVQFVKSVSILDGDKEIQVYTYNSNTNSILNSTSIEIEKNDSVKISDKTTSDITIEIERAFPVTLKAAGKTETYTVSGGTVKSFLLERGFKPDNYDEINYSLDQEISENMVIEYSDIEYITTTKTDIVPRKVKEIPTTKLNVGKREVVSEGADGEEKITTITKFENGKEVDKSITSVVVKKAKAQKVKVGVKYEIADKSEWMSDLACDRKIELDKTGRPIEYKRLLTGVASAYCTGTTCSTGVAVKQGYIAVDPNIIPYGTEMYIRTVDGSWIYGYAVAADTGGFTSWGNTIADLYMYSYSDAVNFGRRDIEIYII